MTGNKLFRLILINEIRENTLKMYQKSDYRSKEIYKALCEDDPTTRLDLSRVASGLEEIKKLSEEILTKLEELGE